MHSIYSFDIIYFDFDFFFFGFDGNRTLHAEGFIKLEENLRLPFRSYTVCLSFFLSFFFSFRSIIHYLYSTIYLVHGDWL